MADKASLEVAFGSRPGGARRAPDEPVRILLLGDFSANPETGGALTPRRIDFERQDAVIAALAPVVRFDSELPFSPGADLAITSMEDFHPDSLARRLPIFQVMRDLAARLGNASTRDQALAELEELTGESLSAEVPAAAPADEPAAEKDSDTVERLLGAPATGPSESPAQQKVAALIRDALGSAQVETPGTDIKRAQSRVAEMMTAAMRVVLGAPQFRSLERAWRSAEWLVQRLDDETAEIYLLDLSREHLVAHLNEHAEHLDRSALHRVLCDPDSGKPWDLLIGDYTFALDAPDLLLLTTLGALAGNASAPFLAHGNPDLFGCPSPAQFDTPWDWALPDDDVTELLATVRAHPAAEWVCLATPGLLLRQPYGPATDPVDAFDFVELPPRPAPSAFVWGNPALGCAYVIARAAASDSALRSVVDLDIEDLPAALYDDGSGQALQPPVEALIGDRARQQIEESGLIALLGHRNSNAVRCPGVFSLSSKPVIYLG